MCSYISEFKDLALIGLRAFFLLPSLHSSSYRPRIRLPYSRIPRRPFSKRRSLFRCLDQAQRLRCSLCCIRGLFSYPRPGQSWCSNIICTDWWKFCCNFKVRNNEERKEKKQKTKLLSSFYPLNFFKYFLPRGIEIEEI